MGLDRNKHGEHEDFFEHNREEDDQWFLKGILGNLGIMMNDISTLKQKM